MNLKAFTYQVTLFGFFSNRVYDELKTLFILKTLILNG
jgi:hypothetical protein